jgi:Fe-Mn family superoxide dismutase
MVYEQKDFSSLLGLKGFSDLMLTNHFSLYGGYVKNVNLITGTLKTLKANSPEYNELKRRMGWEWNGMKMHELYFSNMSKEKTTTTKDSKFEIDFVKSFGTYEKWVEDFKATGMIRGIGWVLLVQDKTNGNLINLWVGEHDEGQLGDQKVLLVMDVWEHAYMTDYGIKRADYINAFVECINWNEVERRSL